jgi:hypothetical protein
MSDYDEAADQVLKELITDQRNEIDRLQAWISHIEKLNGPSNGHFERYSWEIEAACKAALTGKAFS